MKENRLASYLSEEEGEPNKKGIILFENVRSFLLLYGMREHF